MPECVLCITCEDDELRYGKLITKDGISVHTYCLYLSSNLVQKGNLQDEFYGFLKTDIILEKERARKLICYHCKLRGASIGCCDTKCSRSFHLPCAIKHGTINQFVNEYKSFCSRHLPEIRVCPPENQKCDICFEDLVDISGFNSATMIYSQCCQKGWFHKYCLQQYANSAGYFFKCPLCNNKTDFLKVRLWGIFVPKRDAAWETETNAFLELLERESYCVAPVCKIATGRNASPSSLVFCTFCGSNPRHINCVENNDENICSICSLKTSTSEYEVTQMVEDTQKIKKEEFKSDDRRNNYNYQLENNALKEKIYSKIRQKQPNNDKLKNATKCKSLPLSPPRELKSSIINYEAVCTSNILQSDNNHNDADISCIANRVRRRRYNFSMRPNILNDNINSIADDKIKVKNATSCQRRPTFLNSNSASLEIIDEVVCPNNNLQLDKNYNGGEKSCVVNRVRKSRCNSTKGSNVLYDNINNIADDNTKVKNACYYRKGHTLSKSEPVPPVITDHVVCSNNNLQSDKNYNGGEISCTASRVQKRGFNSSKGSNVLYDNINILSNDDIKEKNACCYRSGPTISKSEPVPSEIIDETVCTNRNLLSKKNHDAEISCIANRVRKRRCNSTKGTNVLSGNVNSIADDNTKGKICCYRTGPTLSKYEPVSLATIDEAVCTNRNLLLNKNYGDAEISCIANRVRKRRSNSTKLPIIFNDIINSIANNNTKTCSHFESAALISVSESVCTNNNNQDNNYNHGEISCIANRLRKRRCKSAKNVFCYNYKDSCNDNHDPLEKIIRFSHSRKLLTPEIDEFTKTESDVLKVNDNFNDSADPLENWANYKNKIDSKIEIKPYGNKKLKYKSMKAALRKPFTVSPSLKSLSPAIDDKVKSTAKFSSNLNDSCNDSDDPLANWSFYKNKIDSKKEQKQHDIENLRYKSMNATKYKPFTVSPPLESSSAAINDKVAKCSFNSNYSYNNRDDSLENWAYYKNKTRNVKKTEHKECNINDSSCGKHIATKCKAFTLSPPLSSINDEVINTVKYSLNSNESCNDSDDPLENWAYYKNNIDYKIKHKEHGIESLR